jgi:hypothetical protein
MIGGAELSGVNIYVGDCMKAITPVWYWSYDLFKDKIRNQTLPILENKVLNVIKD